MSYVHESVTPSHTFSGCSRARPTGNDDAYQSGERQALTRLQWQ